MPEPALLLYGVFRTLVAHRVPLGVADYLGAIRALQLPDDALGEHRSASRETLRRLCQILWSRSDGEARLIDEIFKTIPPPPQEDLDELTELLRRADPEPALRQTPDAGGPGASVSAVTDAAVGVGPPTLAVDIRPASDAGGVPLPYPVVPPISGETFVLRPQTVVSARTLAVLWRRYRRMQRTGPAVELDLDATIAQRYRRGIIDRPVLRPARVNRARLLILADVSPSMAVWRPFLDTLAQSLALSRLPGAALLYFSNLPRQLLFRAPSLTGAIAIRTILTAHKGTNVLVVSDAGAARGGFNQRRVEKTSAFLVSMGAGGRSIVWLNPMPADRWRNTTTEALATFRGATFLPLNVPSLIRAVDILRGAKSR